MSEVKLSFTERMNSLLSKSPQQVLDEKIQYFVEDTNIFLDGEINDRNVTTIPTLKVELRRAERALEKAQQAYVESATNIFSKEENLLSPQDYIVQRQKCTTHIKSAKLIVERTKESIAMIEEEVKMLEEFKADLV